MAKYTKTKKYQHLLAFIEDFEQIRGRFNDQEELLDKRSLPPFEFNGMFYRGCWKAVWPDGFAEYYIFRSSKDRGDFGLYRNKGEYKDIQNEWAFIYPKSAVSEKGRRATVNPIIAGQWQCNHFHRYKGI
jgi:hypothetical protein